MANEPIITLVGNLTDDPELRFIPSGASVANFTVASTPRVKDGDSFKDGEAMFVRCAAWRDLAENVAESLTRGTRVIVQGRMTVRSYEHNGEKRTSLELEVDAIGPELRWATANVTRANSGGQQRSARNQGQQGGQSRGGQQGRQQQGGGDPWGQPHSNGHPDPWATPGQPDDPWGPPGRADEPPF